MQSPAVLPFASPFASPFALLFAVALTACGAPEPAAPTHADAWMDGIPGVYALDTGRTLGGKVRAQDGSEVELDTATLARVQEGHGVGSMRLELAAEGTFRLFMGAGEDEFRTAGTWVRSPSGITVVTTSVEGEPAPEEVRVPETYTVERGFLVGGTPGQPIYLRKQPPAPRAP